jgi:conjugal transfer pilus assembly protein TraE
MAGLVVHTPATEQTFEFKIDVKQYSPIITQMATYEGAPKLLKMVEQVEAKQKAEATLEKDQKK